MPVIELECLINADIETCFDLARSIDLHMLSTARTNEIAIAGRTSGLINHGETVTWQATHFGVRQKLTAKISAYNRPFHFRDEQVKGAFKFFVHDHFFETRAGKVLMRDVFRFEAPLGVPGKLVSGLVLKPYLTRFLAERNNMIKEFAETEKWKDIIPGKNEI